MEQSAIMLKQSILFLVFALGMLIMIVSILLTNIYLLGVAELITLTSAFLLIKNNFKQPIKL